MVFLSKGRKTNKSRKKVLVKAHSCILIATLPGRLRTQYISRTVYSVSHANFGKYRGKLSVTCLGTKVFTRIKFHRCSASKHRDLKGPTFWLRQLLLGSVFFTHGAL